MVAVTSYLLFACGAAASAVSPRQNPATVLNNLKTTNTDTRALTTAINNYDGTIAGVAPVQQRVNTVLNDIKTTNQNTVSSPQFNDANSKSIVDYINGTLEPSIKGTVTAIINAKPKFQKSGTTTIVKQNIGYLKGNVTQLASNLVIKASASYKAAASSVSNKVIANINSASAAYP